MWRSLLRTVPLLAMAGLILVGCGGNEQTAGEPTAEQLEIIRQNAPAPVPSSPNTRKIRPDSATDALGAR